MGSNFSTSNLTAINSCWLWPGLLRRSNTGPWFLFSFPLSVPTQWSAACWRAYLYPLQWEEMDDNIRVTIVMWTFRNIFSYDVYVPVCQVVWGIIFHFFPWALGDWQRAKCNVFAGSNMKSFQVQSNNSKTDMENPIMVLCLLWGIISLCGCCFSYCELCPH